MIKRTFIILLCTYLTTSMLLLSCTKKKSGQKVPNDTEASSKDQHVEQSKDLDEQKSVLVTVLNANESKAINSTENTTNQSVAYGRVLQLWKEGNKEEATRMFWQIDWANPQLFSHSPIAGIMRASIDNEYKSFSKAERELIDQQIMDWLKWHATFFRYTRDLAIKAKSDKEYDLAERQLDALVKCGEALVQADATFAIQMNGYSTKQRSLEVLIELYVETGNQTKLKLSRELLPEVKRSSSRLLGR